MLSKSQYKEHILSNKNYPVVFGVSLKREEDAPSPYKTISIMGRRKNTHFDFKEIQPMLNMPWALSWRYVPLTKSVYWWHEPDDDVLEDVTYHLNQKYHEVPKHHIRMYQFDNKKYEDPDNLAAKMTSHQTDFASVNPSKLPSFAQWRKTHRSGD